MASKENLLTPDSIRKANSGHQATSLATKSKKHLDAN